MMMRNIITGMALALMLVSTVAYTQEDQWAMNVLTGPEGAMVPLLAMPLQRTHFSPQERIVIQKTATGSDKWVTVTEVAFPENAAAFRKQLGDEIMDKIKSDFELKSDEDAYRFYVNEPIEKIGLYAFSQHVMEAFGLVYIDKTWKAGQPVRYRVENFQGKTRKGRIELTAATAHSTYPDRFDVNNKLVSDSLVTASWATPSISFKDNFGVYAEVLKSAEGNAYERTQSSVLIRSADSDSITVHLQDVLSPGLRYSYYLRLADWVGNKGIPSDTLHLLAYDASDVSPITELRASPDENGIRLNWNKLPAEAIYTGIAIQKSRNYDSAYVVLDTIAAHETGYLDRRVLNGSMYYYRVTPLFVSEADEEFIKPAEVAATVLFPANQLPPAAPEGLKAAVAENGIRITWWAPDDLDTYGFYVLRGTSLEHMEIISSTVQDTVYTDSLLVEGFSGQIHYAVLAMSQNQQLSDTSRFVTVAVRQPQVLTPPGGLVSRAVPEGAYLVWNNVMDIDDRVTGYTVFRRRQGAERFDVLHTAWQLPDYTDTTAAPGMRYEYAVSTQDIWGNFSVLSPLSLFETEMTDMALDPPLSISLRNLVRGISVSWPVSLMEQIVEYAVYRRAGNARDFIKIGTVPANQSYVDTDVRPDTAYEYYVVAVSEGKEGMPGPSMRISR